MLRYIEGEGGWGKGLDFEKLTNECNDKIDMIMINENFSCIKMINLWFLNIKWVYLGN